MTLAQRSLAVLATILVAEGSAGAQPVPPPKQPAPVGADSGKVDAKSLMQSGVKLFEAKNYLSALAVFKDAYARFASAKILLNIGTTLKALDRHAEAANAYQHYLDSPDADPVKKPEVAATLAELDKKVGTLEITITPPDAQLQINDEEWLPAANAKLYRITDGAFTVRARHDKYQPEAKSAHIASGEKAGLAFTMTAVPEPKTQIVSVPTVPSDNGVHAATTNTEPRSRIGALALAHIEVTRGGGAALIGATFDATRAVQIQGAAIINFNYPGGYVGASFAILPGSVRPLIVAGLPMFSSHGVRVAARAAGGVEFEVNRHFAVIGEVGIDYWFNPEMDKKNLVFIPAVGVSGRL